MSELRYPIFIPSRGRASCASTPGTLERDGLEYTLVVEPDEEQDYRRAFPKAGVLALPECDRGIVYVRQWTLDYARANGHERFWMLDDNIGAFSRVAHRRCSPVPPSEALAYAESLAALRVGLVSLAHRSVAWRCDKAYSYSDSAATCCVLVHTGMGIDYRQSTAMKEDIDYTLQSIQAGWRTVYVMLYAQDKNAMATNTVGGLTEAYRRGDDRQAVAEMLRLWPGTCKPVQKYGRLDLTVDWKRASTRYGVRV